MSSMCGLAGQEGEGSDDDAGEAAAARAGGQQHLGVKNK